MFEGKSSAVSRYARAVLVLFAVLLSGCQPTTTSTATPLPPSVTLVVNPDITDVLAGGDVALTVETSGQDLRFKWSAARGKLSEFDTPAVFYTAPDTPGVDTVTVEVSAAGGTTVEHVSFNIVLPTPSPPTLAATDISPPTGEPTPIVREAKGRVCQYKEDWHTLGNRLFLCTVEFERLRLPIGTQVTVAATINGIPHQAPGLILDHDEGMLDCTFRLNEATRIALGVDDDVKIKDVKDRPIRDFQITVESVPTPPSVSKSFEGRVCRYQEDFLTLGNRLFLRTAEFNRLGLPIGTRVTASMTVNGTPHQVSGLILDHDEGMLECTVRLNEATRIALDVDEDVGIPQVGDHPIRDFQLTTEP